jgi:lipopolysaccharide export system permease protein
VIVSRYLTREVFNALLAITLVLLVAFLSQQLVRYLNFVAMGKIPTNVLLELVGFEIPYLLALLLPLSLYLGILLAYGRLYSDNEMSILQMCGFGNRRLMRLTLFIAIVVSGVVLLLMLWVNPLVSAKRQQLMASDEATLHLIQTLIPGRFQVSPDGTHVMYVEKLSRDHQRAENVFLATQKKNPDELAQNSWTLVLANFGYQEKDKNSNDQFFVTTEGYRYEGIPGQNDYKIIQFKKYTVRIPQTDEHVTHQQVETLPTWQLWRDYANPKSAAELQWRFSIGIATFLLALLAVPLSTVRPRQGRYLTLLPAVLIYIIYMNLLFIARHWVEQGTLPISVGIWGVHGMMAFFIFLIMIVSLKWWAGFKKHD